MNRVKHTIAALAAVLALAVPTSAQERDSKAVKWEKAGPIYEKTCKEIAAAFDEAVRSVDAQFATSRANTRNFVTATLDVWGKLEFLKGGTKQAVNAGAGLLDWALGTKLADPTSPDEFRAFVRKKFEVEVFDPVVFKRGIEAAVASYHAKIGEIEARMVVELQADVADGDLALPPLPGAGLPDGVLSQIDAAIDEVVSDAAEDFVFVAGKEAVSFVAGNWITGGVIAAGGAFGIQAAQNADPTSAVVIGTGMLVGVAVDKGLNMIADASGRDAIGALTEKINGRLSKARDVLVCGSDPRRTERYESYQVIREFLPGSPESDDCTAAMERMDRAASSGLKPFMRKTELRRFASSFDLLHRVIEGVDAPHGSLLNDDYRENLAAIASSAREETE